MKPLILLFLSLISINCSGPTRTVSTKAQFNAFKKEIATSSGQTIKSYLGSNDQYHYFNDGVFLNLLSYCTNQMQKVRVKKSLATITPETKCKPSNRIVDFKMNGKQFRKE